MLLTAIGLVLVVAAALFVAWPMLAGAPGAPTIDLESPLAGKVGALESRRDAALGALKEAEFDHQVGKLSDDDYAALRADLEARALQEIAALDAAHAAHDADEARDPAVANDPLARERAAAGGDEPRRVPAARAAGSGPGPARAERFCATCGRPSERGKGFCAGCGKRVAGAVERPRRRA